MSLWKMEVSKGVIVATYTNPPMNYFCTEGAQEFSALIDQWYSPDIRAVVLTGGIQGKFITHYSVEELVELASNREAMRVAGTSLTRGYHAMLQRMSDLPKPVIVAMNGDTMGGGFELSLACDIRIGQKGDHRYGLPEVKVGILPGGCGTQRLARLVGMGRAVEFILRARVVRPEEALALGLIHEVADNSLARAEEIGAEIASFAPIAVSRAKHALYAGIDTNLRTGLGIEGSAFLETMLSEDALLAMKTYISLPYEKRRDWLEKPTSPEYKGK